MAKGEAKTNNRLLDENIRGNREFQDAIRRNLTDAQDRSTDLFNRILENTNKLGESARGGFQNFADTGGLDPRLQSQLEGDAGAYRAFANKGFTKDQKNRVRGSGIFDWLVKTGGLDSLDKADIMSRAGSAQRSTYENLADEVRRSTAASGGFFSPDAALAKLARESAYGIADVERDARLGISDSVRQGKLAGAQGLSDAERYLISQADQRFATGMAGASGITSGLLDMISRGKQFGLTGLTNLDAMSNDALTRLYGTAPGEVSMYNDLLGRSYGQDLNSINSRIANNPNKSIWDRIGQIAGGVAPLAGGIFSNIGRGRNDSLAGYEWQN